MKKLLLFLLLFSKSSLFSQTVLNSFPIHLNKPLENGQILNTEDVKTHDVYVFAADNKNTFIYKYNKFLFLTNQLTDSINNIENRSLIGHSISEDGNPTLYWGSDTARNIRIIKYYFETKTSRALNFEFPDYSGSLITSFQKNNIFYILSKEKNENHLLLYEFSNGKCEIKMFDFSSFIFKNEKGQRFTFSSLIQYFPIENIDSDNFNPLEKSVNKSKMYVLDNHIILTLDYNSKQTHVFDLNLESLDVTEKIFNQPVSKKQSASSNSFYLENKLLQINANNEELLFEIKDFESGKSIKTVSVSKNDTIRFKNSPLFIKSNGQRPEKLKTTSKFLKNLSMVNVGVSAFKNKNNTFITFGGFAEYEVSIPNFDYRPSDYFGGFNDRYTQYANKMVFFDAMLDSKFDFTTNEQPEILAIDNVFYFMSKNKNIALEHILKLQDYYILGYYDLYSKKYVIRKFTDGFMNEDNGNPIINKAQFTKSVPLNRN
ncbi:hypothetical protein [Flavobacterium branchiicola]|uniref:6-bladed beta-propeller protein n=1 Tax=Flavobacterium branchiicola TaxID=1114875 RepID=A0ABV9PLD6_9FLAO|nr:hypothetical protein [Flavobacterium branchiicola]MBS7256679.1 hypothetical protein [Flavobacterium branchiicola]